MSRVFPEPMSRDPYGLIYNLTQTVAVVTRGAARYRIARPFNNFVARLPVVRLLQVGDDELLHVVQSLHHAIVLLGIAPA